MENSHGGFEVSPEPIRERKVMATEAGRFVENRKSISIDGGFEELSIDTKR